MLEFIGYEDAWLLTKPGLKKNYKKDYLIEHIQYQRKLIRELYNKLDEELKGRELYLANYAQ
ncbi:hypothetical protein NRS6085_11710 [Bacillus subtilis]|nr:hypothetical protein NRS6085_04109 [Bacillus subtilis]CAI6276236.1 hypothetical protein NRS6085_11710 [Bacillus subtilis]